MTAPVPASNWVEVADLTGPPGTSITGAEVNSSGDLIISLSTGGTVNAGLVKGGDGARLDIGNSVQAVADLPDTPPVNSAFYVRDTGRLYVYEGDDGADDGKPGYTDVGPIRGETGATGAPGAPGVDGVSVVGAAINGSGHLIISLSAGGPVDAGVARGADGAPGAPGADGAAGRDGLSPITYLSGSIPAASGYYVGQIAFGSDGKMLRAV